MLASRRCCSGSIFVLAGLAFKISAVPFHMWTPDVYEGAPTPVTTFFAIAPKVAAIALTARVALDRVRAQATHAWRQIVIFAALASIVVRRARARSARPTSSGCSPIRSINNVGFIADRPCRRRPSRVRARCWSISRSMSR